MGESVLKLIVTFPHKKRYLKAEKPFCRTCGDFTLHVHIKPDCWPTEVRAKEPELNSTQHICVRCHDEDRYAFATPSLRNLVFEYPAPAEKQVANVQNLAEITA